MRQFLLIFMLLAGIRLTYAVDVDVREGYNSQNNDWGRSASSSEIFRFSGRFQYQVFERVYDGDTVLLSNGSKVRLLSSNTPEIESPHRSGSPGGEEARLWLKEAVEGKKVYLEEDV